MLQKLQSLPRSSLKKLDKEGADGVPALAAVALHRLHVVDVALLLFRVLLFLLLLLLLLPPFGLPSFWALAGRRNLLLASALPVLLPAALGQFHVGLRWRLLAGFGLQNLLSVTGILPFLQLTHQLLPVLAGLQPVALAEFWFTSVATPVPDEEGGKMEDELYVSLNQKVSHQLLFVVSL